MFFKILCLLPIPRIRHNMFSVTNTLSEALIVIRDSLFGAPDEGSKAISLYENEFAKFVGAKYAVSFASGRMTLYAILKSLNLKPDDEIIIPAYTCVVVPNAILYAGIKPIYVDISPIDFNATNSNILAAITKRTKIIYIQHTFGNPHLPLEALEFAKRNNILVLEDCAHIFCADTPAEHKVGSLGHVAFYSTDHSKYISTYLGGIATTSDENLFKALKNLQNSISEVPFKRRQKLTFILESIFYSRYFYWIGGILMKILDKIGLLFYFRDELSLDRPTWYQYPSKLSAWQARLGLSQLALAPQIIKTRKDKCQKYDRLLDLQIANRAPAPLRYSFLVRDPKLITRMLLWRLDIGFWFTSPFHGRSSNLADLGYTVGSCPVSEFVSKHIVNLPTHEKFDIKVVERLLKSIDLKGEIIKYPVTD